MGGFFIEVGCSLVNISVIMPRVFRGLSGGKGELWGEGGEGGWKEVSILSRPHGDKWNGFWGGVGVYLIDEHKHGALCGWNCNRPNFSYFWSRSFCLYFLSRLETNDLSACRIWGPMEVFNSIKLSK